MGSTFLYPPAKRTVPIHAAMPDPTTSSKRSKPPSSTLPVPPGHVSFRLLCHSSRTGGVIGKSGSVIKQLQQETGSKIRIEEALPESPDRVITIVAPSSGGVSSGELIQVSKGQDALVRVFERILAVAAESDSMGMAAEGGVASCRLLAEASHVGSVIGKGGKIVEKIRKDCGVKIRILTDKLPVCAGPTEEVIEIEGKVTAVKKALVAVSRCLQECQLDNKTRVTGTKHVELGPQDPLPQVHVEIPAQYNPAAPMLPNRSFSYAPVATRSLALDSDNVSSTESTNIQQTVVFRFLSSNDRIGGIIGKGGNVIKGIQSETGATIAIGNAVAECDDRLITVTASENPESRYSAAQKTIVLVFSRAVDAATEKGIDSASSRGSSVTAKLVISSNQIGCLLGKGGTIISEMRKVTGASIRIVGGDQVPKCVPTNDHVVQISGDFMNVKDAIYHVTGRLRDNLFSSFLSTPGTRNNASILTENSPYLRMRDPLQEPSRDTLVRDPFRDSSLRDPFRDSSLGDPLRDSSLRDPLRDPPLRYPLRDASLSDPSRDASLRDLLRETSLRDPLRDPSLRDPLGDPALRDPLGDPSLRDMLRDPLRNPLRDTSRDTLMDPLRGTLMEPLRNTLRGLPGGPFREPIRDPVSFSLPPSRGVSHSISQHPVTQNMDHLGLSQSVDHPTSPRLWASQTVTGVPSRGITDIGRGLGSVKGGLEHGSGSKSAFVMNTTVEIVVPENAFGSVYGENGGNLARLRLMSGAKVIVHEPRLGTSDRIIVISGTPDETQAAQSLLQAFILTGQP